MAQVPGLGLGSRMTVEPDEVVLPLPQGASSAVIVTAAANVALALVALATGVLSARLLGPERRGYLAAAQAIGTLIGALGTLCLAQALVYFVGRRARQPMVVLKTATVFAAGWMIILSSVAVLAMPLLLSGEPSAIPTARLYCLFGLTLVFLGFPIVLIRALQQYWLWNVLRLIAPLCWLSTLLLFTFTKTRRTLPLIGIFLLLQALFIPLVWFLARQRSSGSGRIDITLFKPMLSYGTPLLLAILPREMNFRFDQLLIVNVEDAQQLGLYAVSVSWAGLGLPLIGAVGYVLVPKLTAMNDESARRTLARSSRAGVAIALALGAVSALSAPFLVPLLFGNSFSVPIALPLVLAAATSILGLNGIVEEGLQGVGEPRPVLFGELVGLALTLPLLFLLVPTFGILGAAVASLVGYAAVCASLSSSARRRLGISPWDLLVPRRTDLRRMQNRFQLVIQRQDRQ